MEASVHPKTLGVLSPERNFVLLRSGSSDEIRDKRNIIAGRQFKARKYDEGRADVSRLRRLEEEPVVVVVVVVVLMVVVCRRRRRRRRRQHRPIQGHVS